MQPDETYSQAETPLERAARTESESETPARAEAEQAAREEHEADVVVGDINSYVAQTDPASLPEAEAALNAWQIPTDPREGVPGDAALTPEADGEPLEAVFTAQTEAEASIVQGLLESEGIPAILDGVPAPVLGSAIVASVSSTGEACWGSVLVSHRLAAQARAVLAAATQSPSAPSQAAQQE